MKMSNTQLERLAVNAVNCAAIQPGSLLIPNLSVGDKGISFDGTISVFADEFEKKESLVGNVPVQVKGTLVKKFNDGLRSYSLNMAHYKNYIKSDGVLFLVVEIMDNGETKIFYKSLLGMELSQLIEHYGHQKSKSVELRPLEETDLNTVCHKFLYEQKYQPKMLVEKKAFSLDAFETYTFSSLTFNPDHPQTSSIFEHDFTLYGMLNDMYFPLQVGRILSMDRSGLTNFLVNGQSFDLMVNITYEMDKMTLVFEEVFAITIDQSKQRYYFRFLGFHSVVAQLKVIPFIIELFAGHPVEFLDGTIALNEDAQKLQDYIPEMYTHQKNLHNIAHVFQLLGIPENTIFTESEGTNIYRVLRLLSENISQNQLKGMTLKDPENPTLINLAIGDKAVVLYYNPKGDALLTNGFSDKILEDEFMCSSNPETEWFQHSSFTMIDEEALAKSVNFNPETIKESFDRFDPFLNEAAFNLTNQFCLRCVQAYDQSGKYSLLEIANYVYDKFPTASDAERNSTALSQIVFINKIQIQIRLSGKLTEADIKALIQVKREATIQDNQELLFCINVLLDNKLEASDAFNQWDIEKQEFYKGFPIYKLYLDL